MALRGHRDSGKNSIITAPTDKNQSNFRAILRYRAKGDELLKNALEGPGERNKYTSPTIQNEIIDSFLADETADISGVEQVSLCVRYVDLTTLKIKEHFLQFVPTADVTGEGLAKVILNNLREFGIDKKYLRGQGYDGAAAMSDALSEVSEWKDRVTANEARSLVNGITQGKFIIALFVTAKLFALGYPLSKHLQKISIDLKEAVSLAEGTISEMQKLRNNAEDEFKEIFKQATLLANEVSAFIVIPRLTAHQRHRSNPGNQNTPEDYYRVTLFIPYVERFLSELKKRFIDHKEVLAGFQALFPNKEGSTPEEPQQFDKESQNNFEYLIKFYSEDFNDNPEIIIAERKLCED
ncbi:52 kDa repressor of the inhibitor of the protein kinase-like [Tenebrio molitor]|uniref:52 kDa repressor of the inhibitor of the protein kinase-like n=1 Tax=Tenebrio molitor TaxID=7067 RepID=UPI003624986E